MDDGIRLERALKREQRQNQPNYNELCRRFLADDLDFSKENLKIAGIKKEYLNYDLLECNPQENSHLAPGTLAPTGKLSSGARIPLQNRLQNAKKSTIKKIHLPYPAQSSNFGFF